MPTSKTCPRECGGKLVAKLTVEHDPDYEIKPRGGVLVCDNCGHAADPSADEAEQSAPAGNLEDEEAGGADA
jgi:hypothetical protein